MRGVNVNAYISYIEMRRRQHSRCKYKSISAESIAAELRTTRRTRVYIHVYIEQYLYSDIARARLQERDVEAI